MAITRAQQAKQMLQDGGMLVQPSMTGKRPGYRGDAAARSTGAKQSGRADPGSRGDPGEGRASKGSGVSESTGGFAPTKGKGASVGPSGRDDTVDPTRVKESREEFETAVGKANLERLYDDGVPKSNLPSFLGMGLNAISPFRNFTLRKNIDYFESLKSRNRLQNYPPTLEGYTQYMKDRSAGTIDAAGNPVSRFDDDSDNSNFIPVDTTFAQAPGDTDQGTETEEDPFRLALAFRKDGGRIGAMDGGMMSPEGGIMDLETGRQMYFLGKLVKKATRAVKKVVKSPIGKAALVAGLGYGLGGGTFFGKMLPGVTRGGQGFGGFGGLSAIFGNVGDIIGGTGLGDKFAKAAGSKIGLGIAGASVLAGLLTPQQEEEAQQLVDNTGIDIEAARNQILNAAKNQDDFRARAFKADGGIMRLGYQEGSKEPVAKKTMPLLDMDGKEMDLREDGGFVPIGRMEKADDVPARLSKNEFVFTADAVRNAGDGNVDKGAEVMYNMMKNLESGGDVSEESQGLEGAREMFQTSQRLEEVL